jgi:hypothetical protein
LADDSEPSQYIVIGSHSTISACTLPPWLPAQIVDSMNQVFGGMLRDELVKLMRPTLVRSRATSTGSRRISSDSAEEVPEMGPPPTNRSRISRVVAAYRAAKASGSQGR